jgi:hypothetical protein
VLSRLSNELVPAEARQIVVLQNDDEAYDNEDDDDNEGDSDDDSMMGIRILNGFHEKDMAYILFHNDDTWFSPAFFSV